jgi:hypothetical protein
MIRYKDKFALDAYEYARSGMSMKDIASAIGISYQSFHNWVKKKKIFRDSLKRGIKHYKNKAGGELTLQDYLVSKLPANLSEYYKKIEAFDRSDTAAESIDALMSNKGKDFRQGLFVYAMIKNNFKINPSLRLLNIAPATYYRWIEDPDFLNLIDQIKWLKGNFYEDALLEAVNDGDIQAIKFANETFNRDRGYGKQIDINIDQSITNRVIKLEEINLTLGEKKRLLNKFRQAKQIESKEVSSNEL